MMIILGLHRITVMRLRINCRDEDSIENVKKVLTHLASFNHRKLLEYHHFTKHFTSESNQIQNVLFSMCLIMTCRLLNYELI